MKKIEFNTFVIGKFLIIKAINKFKLILESSSNKKCLLRKQLKKQIFFLKFSFKFLVFLFF